MNNYTLNSSYYIVFKNGECIQSQLPDYVVYENQSITFQNKMLQEIQIVYLLDQDMNITYHIESNVNVHIIETRIIEKGTLHKTMYIADNGHVHIFHENNCQNDMSVSCHDDVYLSRDASCQSAYAELSDGSFDGIYHYYLDGENADAQIRMAVLSKEKEEKHFEVLIQHNCPYTYGQMDNYGVVKDHGKLVLDGIGTITKGQHGAASHQTNKIMVFDKECIASANPYLYIDEFDVKASHAAGVGKMDEEHLYYLQSRGLTKKQAMHLITYGYLKPVVEVIDNKMLKEHFETVLSKVGA